MHCLIESSSEEINLSLDIVCSLKLTVFLKLLSSKAIGILEQIMLVDKYLCIFLHQMEAIVYM